MVDFWIIASNTVWVDTWIKSIWMWSYDGALQSLFRQILKEPWEYASITHLKMCNAPLSFKGSMLMKSPLHAFRIYDLNMSSKAIDPKFHLFLSTSCYSFLAFSTNKNQTWHLGLCKKLAPRTLSFTLSCPKSYKMLVLLSQILFTFRAHEVGNFTSKWDFAFGRCVKLSTPPMGGGACSVSTYIPSGCTRVVLFGRISYIGHVGRKIFEVKFLCMKGLLCKAWKM